MKYYLIGIKGAGLSALALILHDLGYKVVGYDDEVHHQFTEDELIKRGIKIYHEENDEIDENTIVVRSSAVSLDHSEVKKALQLKVEVIEYNEMLGRLTNMFSSITIAGCHGKTTTTSMLSYVLDNIVGANYLIGDGTGHASRENKLFILEACEYRRNFLAYSPTYAVITNIDLDHVDYYKDIDDVISAYQEYASKAKKMVIACGDDPYTHKLNLQNKVYYGFAESNDIVAKNIKCNSYGSSFDVYIKGNYYGSFNINLCGKHIILDTLAVISVCYYEGIDAKTVGNFIEKFKGAKRRFEEITIGSNVIVDDYAHHPVEVNATIEAARQKYPNKKIVAIFQPHTYTRTLEFKDALASCLNKADRVYLLDIYSAREKQEDYPLVTSNIILENLTNGKIVNDSIDDFKDLENTVYLFMSPKEIDELKSKLIAYLKNKC